MTKVNNLSKGTKSKRRKVTKSFKPLRLCIFLKNKEVTVKNGVFSLDEVTIS